MPKEVKFFNAKQIIIFMARLFVWLIFAVLLVVASFLLFYTYKSKEAEKKGQHYEPYYSLYTIISPSMEPKIKVYDVILNKRIDDLSTLKTGDVVTFKSTAGVSNGLVVTHRIIEIVPYGNSFMFRTRGDNNDSRDEGYVTENNIMGKVLIVLPKLGKIQFFLASKQGWIFVILFPAIGIVAYDIMRIIKLMNLKRTITENDDDSIDQAEAERRARELIRKKELRAKKKDHFDK